MKNADIFFPPHKSISHNSPDNFFLNSSIKDRFCVIESMNKQTQSEQEIVSFWHWVLKYIYIQDHAP